MEEQKLRQFFRNNSNCYADSDDIIQAMDEDCFIVMVNAWQQRKIYSEENLKLAFETGRNFQLTGENNFKELIEQLNKESAEKNGFVNKKIVKK